MLSYDDKPTIRNAILKRIGTEPGAKIMEVRIKKRKGFIAVGVEVEVDHHLRTCTRFDLPEEFDYRLLHDEIDETAEQIKAAKREFFGRGGIVLLKPGGILAGKDRKSTRLNSN